MANTESALVNALEVLELAASFIPYSDVVFAGEYASIGDWDNTAIATASLATGGVFKKGKVVIKTSNELIVKGFTRHRLNRAIERS